MNNTAFVSGGKTGRNPTLLVKLFDESGINVIGNSIGHDLVAVLDGDSRQTYVLNAFYEADIDDYRSGVVRFPLSDLEPGPHSIQVTAWDVANNFAEASTEFIVVVDRKNVIRNVSNYPNPMISLTTFEFEHDLNAASIDAYVDIFDVNGRLVGSVEEKNVVSSNGFIGNITWDGKEGGERPANQGIYFYQVRLVARSETGGLTEHKGPFSKLILMN